MVAWLFLAASLVGAAFTLGAWLRPRRLWFFVVPYFFARWLTGELVLHHFFWQALATVAFVAFGALEAWPGAVGLAVTVASWGGMIALQHRASKAEHVLEGALREALGDAYHREIEASAGREPSRGVQPRRLARPFRMRHPQVERIRDIEYGDAGARHRLDVYRHRERPDNCPTLLQIHGGAWTIGSKEHQGLPLMTHLAARGWLCVAANYRLSPTATFPDHLVDVKRALAWIREHAGSHGADPDFVAVTGGSAGGHLAALTALTANDPALQPGFEHVDTSVAACVPFYGVYDFLERHGGQGRASMRSFLERYVMKSSPEHSRERWEGASPIDRIHGDAPAFFVIHGTHDSLALVEDARAFVGSLEAESRSPLAYAELPGAEHAFDIFHSLRSAHAVNAVSRFLDCVYARHRVDAGEAEEGRVRARGSG